MTDDQRVESIRLIRAYREKLEEHNLDLLPRIISVNGRVLPTHSSAQYGVNNAEINRIDMWLKDMT